MVSSFEIKTNIKVGKKVAKAFNRIAERVDENNNFDCSVVVKPYFDSMAMNIEGEAYLDSFLESDHNYNGMENFFVQNWRFDEDGILYDECGEKFHGAISVLEYFIQTFFEPMNIKLNGTIVGVNTEAAMAYVYHVKDNVIEMDEQFTRAFNRFCDTKEKEYRKIRELPNYRKTKEYQEFLSAYEYVDQLFEIAVNQSLVMMETIEVSVMKTQCEQ